MFGIISTYIFFRKGFHLNIGQKIKLERLKSHMTQQQLAEGICSTSYLSKIEKNHVVPKQAIQRALFDRLHISETPVELDESAFMTDLLTAYRVILESQSADHARIAYNTFFSEQITFTKQENFYTTNLYLLYFAIIAKEPASQIKHLLYGMLAIKYKFTPYQKYVFHVVRALYHYEQNDFEEAQSQAVTAEKIHSLHHVADDIEYAELLYTEGLIYLRTYEHGKAFSKVNKALKLFAKHEAHELMLKSYNLLGLINLQFGNFDQALKYLNDGYDYAVQLQKTAHYGQLLQNIGYTYARMQQPKIAIQYYRRSLKAKELPLPQLVTIHSIVKEYSKIDHAEQIDKWCKEGLAIIAAHDLRDEALSYYYHFQIYPMLHKLEEFNAAYLDKAIHHFTKLKDHRNVQKYALALAKNYELRGDFMQAVEYYRLANEASFSVRGIKAWQDL